MRRRGSFLYSAAHIWTVKFTDLLDEDFIDCMLRGHAEAAVIWVDWNVRFAPTRIANNLHKMRSMVREAGLRVTVLATRVPVRGLIQNKLISIMDLNDTMFHDGVTKAALAFQNLARISASGNLGRQKGPEEGAPPPALIPTICFLPFDLLKHTRT